MFFHRSDEQLTDREQYRAQLLREQAIRDVEHIKNGEGSDTGEVQSTGTRASAVEDPVLTIEQERQRFIQRAGTLNVRSESFSSDFIEELFSFAARVNTSDIHLQPIADGLELKFRDDGMLKRLEVLNTTVRKTVTARLKVMADLLTYKSEIPQEGRVQGQRRGAEVRVSTFPTMHGERVVLRFFSHHGEYQSLANLGHDPEIVQLLEEALLETSGAILICGPAGSGKSTTMYACLRHLIETSRGTQSILTLEDPIEVPLEGIAQSQVNAPAGFDLHTGLRSLLRQDPEVFAVGEIRDPTTAKIAFQACLAGQLLLATFHADSVATAITRMIDMNIDPYHLRSGLVGILCQRLVRKSCACATWSEQHEDKHDLPIDRTLIAKGCDECQGTGYRGRRIIGEYLPIRDSDSASHLIGTIDSRTIYREACDRGMVSIWQRATQLVREGMTTAAEVRRVLGRTMRI